MCDVYCSLNLSYIGCIDGGFSQFCVLKTFQNINFCDTLCIQILFTHSLNYTEMWRSLC